MSTAGATVIAVTGCTDADPVANNSASGVAPSNAAQPQETGWSAKTPPLKTPWTDKVSAQTPFPDYPRPQLRRSRWVNLNGVWQFGAATEGDPAPVGKDLPERILVPYPVEAALSGIGRHESRMFYRRRFVVPDDWAVGRKTGNRLLVNFDAIDFEATIWVNGNRLATHSGGYDRFTVDVTDALQLDGRGQPTGPQELIVGVFDPTEHGQQAIGKQHVSAINNPKSVLYYTPSSGIWQSVWMEVVPTAYIARLEMTPKLPDGALDILVRAPNGDGYRVEATAIADGRKVGEAAGAAGQPFQIKIDQPRNWSPEDPFLYDLKLRLLDGSGKPVDQVDSYFGMRSIAIRNIDGHPRIVLNGERAFMLSTLQQGFWPDGIYTAATDDALIFDLEQNKRLGFNTARKHQKVEPDRWYYHADRLGLMVWQDMPATSIGRQPPHQREPAPPPPAAAAKQFEDELRRMVDQLRNFPSVVVWTPFNEGWGEYDTARIAAMVKQWDPSRLVDEMSGFNVCDCSGHHGDLIDRHNLGVVYPGPAPQPDGKRAAVIGEFGALGLTIAGHSWDAKNAHPNVKVENVDDMTAKYVEIMHDIAKFVEQNGLASANYNLFEDAEHQTNGLFTYDRQLLKPNADKVRAANRKVLEAGYGRAVKQPNGAGGTA